MQRGEQRYGREGRHFIQQQCGRQKGEREREIIACLRAAILSCAMNTKDTALELTPPPPNTHLSRSLCSPIENAAELQMPKTTHRYLFYSLLKAAEQQPSSKSICNYSYQTSMRTDPTSTDKSTLLSRFHWMSMQQFTK